MKQHKVWVDWLKALAMLTIVWGHCFPQGGIDSFLYAFNVPVFFWASGYLAHPEKDFRTCWQKCWHNLLVPYLILALLKTLGPIIKHITDGQFIYSLIGIAGGFHTFNGMTGCNNLWFVYTLILVKLIYQPISQKPKMLLLVTLLAIGGALVYNHLQLKWTWAVSNVMLAWPFFMLGNLCSQAPSLRFEQFVERIQKQHPLTIFIGFIILATATYQTGLLNSCAYLFQNCYGNNFIIFLCGALLGIGMMLLLSNLLNKNDLKVTKIISTGSIVILVFHRELLHPMLKFIGKQDLNLLQENLAIFIAALITTLAFVPVILLLKRYFPIILGTRAKNI